MSDKVTARPWVYDEDRPTMVYSDDATGSLIARLHGEGFDYVWRSKSEAKANAAHIVKCVNYHERLVEALEMMVNECPGCPDGELENASKLLNELDT